MREIRLMGAVTAAIGACVLLLTFVSSVSADPPDKVTLAVFPSSITANGLTTTTITATVTDQGALLDGVTVTFTSTLGVFANWEQTIIVTTTQGVAVTWLRSVPASGTVTSTVEANAAGTAFTSTQVLFTANPCQSDLTAWTEYAANPIFGQGVDGNTLRAYYPSVLYDSDRFGGHGDARYYKMWYGTRIGSDYRTGYAVSDDGIHWVTVTVPVTNINGYHAHVLYDSDRFGGAVDDPYYKMWYWDVSNSINYATSDDGVDWADYAGNPVITNALGWGSAPVYDAFVVYNSSGDPAQYEAWIDNNGRLYYITSTNGITWIGNNQELLADRESWELSTYSRASVLKLGGAYHMWYGGGDDQGGNHGIGYAVSTDGQQWIKSVDNPIFHKDDGPVWRDERSYTPRVLYSVTRFDGHGSPEEYKMWFSGRDTGGGNYTVGHATLNPTTLSLGDTSGSGQSGVVVSVLSQPFVVGLRDSCGDPASGVSVTFVISGSPAGAVGQGLSVLAGATGVSGQISTTLTFGSKPGAYTVTALATGVSGMPTVFTSTATPGPVHRFAFATIGDQVETYPFTITVTAEDAFSNTVTAYTAPVALTDTTGTINPALSGSFAAGVLTQAVTINAEGTDVVITAAHTTTPAILGVSNPFEVIPVRVVNLNTGEWFVTIQDAIDDADTLSGAGHVISVTAGVYNENVNITKNDLTLAGVGPGTDPARHTIIDGLTPEDISGSPGINLPSGVTGVTIRDLRVQDFHNSRGINTGARNNDFVVSNTHVYSNAINLASFANGGIYMRGPVTNVLVTGSELQHNRGRGFVIWNGFKQHITVTNNVVRYNNCCGIELQDGTASGVLIAGNIVEENADNGIGLVGLTSGGGPNRVFSNTLRDNGRFGIEIKLPDGTGLGSGDGSIVVEENRVERTFVPVDARDLVGIAAFRRGWVPGNGNVDIPTGVMIKENLVHGYMQTTTSDGFGIVVEGTNMTVLSNTVTGNDVGIQVQAGHQPYVPNTSTDGDQSNVADDYFGRGNSPVGEGWLDSNSVTNNGVGIRVVNGTLTATNNVISGSTSAGVILTGTGTVTVTLGGDPPGANAFRENGSSGVAHVTVTLPYTNPAIHAYYNDWGAVALADIEDSIYHQADDLTLAEVVYYDLTVSDDGGSPMADGVSTALVTATLTGLLQPAGHVVSFTTDIGTLSVATGTTDSDGVVTTTLTSLSEGTATITGTAGMGGDNPRSDATSVPVVPLTLDHFHVYLVQDQIAGVGFPVAISARDAGDLILTGFNGQATLTDTTGTLVPVGQIEFHNGVWNGIVTITQAYAGDVITAAYIHDADKNGVSNAFDIVHNVATSVAISPAAATVAAGQSVTYTVWATDAYGNDWDATSTAHYAIAREAGGAWADNVYTPQYSGTWTITSTVNGVDDSASLVVTPGPATGITLTPATYTVTAGDTVVYTVAADDGYGNVWDVTATAAYTVTLEAGGAWVGPVYTSQFVGTWTVSTTWNSFSTAATLHVITATVAEIRLSPASAIVTAGQPMTYAVVATDTSGNRWNATAGTYFVIDGGAKGGWTGNVYSSEAAGVWTVTAFYGGKADTAVLTVAHGVASGIEVSPSVYTATAGSAVVYAVWAIDAYGNGWNATAEASYASENDAGGAWVGSVYATQWVGTWTITATLSGLTDTALLYVVGATVVEIGLSPASATVTAGQSVAYTVIATDTGGNQRDATASAQFVIDSGAQGAWVGNVYMSETSGDWKVTAVYNGRSDSAALIVVHDAATDITLSPQVVTTTADAAVAYTVHAVDALGNDWDATTEADYAIGVGAGGMWAGSVYTPELVGTWTVMATLDGRSDNGILAVAHGRAAAVTLSPASAVITAGQSITYAVWAMDAHGNGWDATMGAIYVIEGGAGGSWTNNVYTSQSAGTWAVSTTVDSVYGTAALTVTRSEGSIPGVNVMPTTVDVEEGGITATYSLSLNSEPTDIVTITITADGQTVVEPDSVTFNVMNWDTTQRVAVAAVDDAEVEGVHISTISHRADSADSNYSGIAIADIVVNVTDNDISPAPTLVQFSNATYRAKETADLANVTVTLNTASSVPVTVTYVTDDGTAIDGYDYAAVGGTLCFDVGQITQAFGVPILGDVAFEGDETVRLLLSSPIHATLGVPSEAVLIVVDNVLLLPCTMRDSGQ